eukprot:TRINITY_DN45886_c0_g1_i1.p4 TRINITY_DN45886_c0_g1~~TRINITY_DN45886_c0_g1_i1.p4  ORF type:complete len:105 (-),score=10.23 TRINITY_DN45886_c0_g1_i1:362-676(-)
MIPVVSAPQALMHVLLSWLVEFAFVAMGQDRFVCALLGPARHAMVKVRVDLAAVLASFQLVLSALLVTLARVVFATALAPLRLTQNAVNVSALVLSLRARSRVP